MTVWSIPEAKAKLSEILSRARAGEKQVIGDKEPCIVLSLAEYQLLQGQADEPHLGKWLVAHMPRAAFDSPDRSCNRPDPFED